MYPNLNTLIDAWLSAPKKTAERQRLRHMVMRASGREPRSTPRY